MGGADGAEQYALAFADLLDSLRQRQVDVLAHAEGVGAAIALEALRPGSLVRRMVFSAAAPAALEAARRLKVEFRELPLATASEEAIPATAVNTQLVEITEFFRIAKPGAQRNS